MIWRNNSNGVINALINKKERKIKIPYREGNIKDIGARVGIQSYKAGFRR